MFIFPKKIIHFFGSSKILKSFRDWFFDRSKIIKKSKFIKWNGFNFFLSAPPQILRKAYYKGIESSLTTAMLKLINPNSNIIDIGASYGFISIVLSRAVNDKGGKVFSFEAEYDIVQNLKQSLKKNKIKNVNIFNNFVGDENIKNIRTVDSLITNDNLNFDLIKIDTDGSDLDALKGCSKIIKKSQPIIVIEINNNYDIIYKYLENMGYGYFYDQYLNDIESYRPNYNRIPNLIASTKKLNPANLL